MSLETKLDSTENSVETAAKYLPSQKKRYRGETVSFVVRKISEIAELFDDPYQAGKLLRALERDDGRIYFRRFYTPNEFYDLLKRHQKSGEPYPTKSLELRTKRFLYWKAHR